jgi:hypothetical protein
MRSKHNEYKGVFRAAINKPSLSGKNSVSTGLWPPYFIRFSEVTPDVGLGFPKRNGTHNKGGPINRDRLTAFRRTVGCNVQGRRSFQTSSGSQIILQSEVNPGTPNTNLLDPFFDLRPSRAVGIFNLGQGPHAANAFVDANTDSMRGNLFRFFRAGNRKSSQSQGAEK